MKTTPWRWLIAFGLTLPLMAAEAPEKHIEQAGRPNPGSNSTSYRLELNFETGKADVIPDHDKDIRRVTDYLKNYPHATCQIRGYTDNVGSDEINLKISQERAENVRRYMIDQLGIRANRVKARGYGNSEPIASNDTEEGRTQNRRIIAVVKS